MMKRNIIYESPFSQFEIHQINSTGKIRDSPTSSILKTPTAIFVTTRSSSAKTKKLTFANGPVDLQTLKNGTSESNVLFDSETNANGERKLNNGEIGFEENIVEVAISPVKTMKVSPESWKAFLEYKKRYSDYANETEKTDYTYSRLSKFCHKEIIPGFLIRPNLSRLSITSKRSSFSSPNSPTSLSETQQLKNYDFKVFNHSDSDIFNDLNQSSKLGRSKYYLRSSSFDWRETGEADPSARNYFEKDFYGSTPVEKITKSYAYTTTEAPEPTGHHYGKVRQMELDDADIDEVDDPLTVSPVHSPNQYYTGSDRDVSRLVGAPYHPQTSSGYFKNFFTAMFLYITSVGTVTKDLFSKYVLRRRDDGYRSQFAPRDWRSENYGAFTSDSWSPWKGREGGYYGRPLTWSQRIYYYFTDKVSQLKNLIWGDGSGRSSYAYADSSRRRKFWWLFIPLLLLAGSFLGYIDFFSNPKAILNILYNWVLFIPSFLHYTFAVFIPWLIFEALPYLVLQAIPKFIMVTLPYFFTNAVPYYFWVVVHFFAGLTLTRVWDIIVGALTFGSNCFLSAGGAVLNILTNLMSNGYFISSKYLMLFYSNFSMMIFHLFTISFDLTTYFSDCVVHAVSAVFNLFK